MSGGRRVSVAAALVLLLAAAGCGSGSDDSAPAVVVHQHSGGGVDYAGVEIDPGFRMPRATLTDENGARVHLGTDLDRPVSVFFFGYTLCTDVCPLIMADLSLAVARLPSELRDKVEVVFVTSDPARDTPDVLRTYLDRYNADFTGLTGPLGTIVDVAQTMGVAVAKGPRLPSGGFEVLHGAELVGYAAGSGVVVWTEGTSVDDLAADLARLVATAAEAETPTRAG